ncbi:MAG: CHASE2 domain-containing protein [Betaproteobacteria bacterium]|nr:CHASE2 domain-containing protein [Betaproteobacteria bacterium]
MKNLSFWKSDWFLGAMVAVVLIIASGGDLIQSLERKAYDLGVRAASRTPFDRIAVIAIDDQSIANIGRWPWSRDVHAKMTEILVNAKAKTIGYMVFFSEPQVDAGLVYINKLSEAFAASRFKSGNGPESERFEALLNEAAATLNTDQKLGESFKKAGNVLLPLVFQQFPFEPQGNPDRPLPDYVLANGLALSGKDADYLPPPGINPAYPIPQLAAGAAAIGHLNAQQDVDGATRTEPLIVRYYDKFFPSLSLQLAAKSLNLQVSDIQAKLGEEVRVGKLRVRTDPEMRMYTFFYADRDGKPAFTVDSFFDVYTGKIPAAKYQDKIVVIGASAAGVGISQVTPIAPSTSPALTMAHTVSSILKEDFFVAPTWSVWIEKLVFLLVAVYLIALLPRLKAGMGAICTASMFVALLAAHFVLMATQLMWLQLMAAVTLLVIGHLALTTKHFLVTEKSKARSDVDLAQSHRMLGLGYQGQGQLDTAFDYFRKLPVDDSVADLLYNLALDFERKRQFNKAESVFRHVADHNPKFRDVAERLGRAKAMSETVILGGGGSHPGGTVIMPGGGVEKPMLGRYQVEKELGKGAMGVVYLGKDPKIGRVVAIKTMALSQEFEADELQDVKDRFFREAETAGRLNHPHIVTIFDAGEEHDLAYIAMEFLKGKDLTPFIKPDNLLPLPKVMSIIARVAEALSYAHTNNVVHRDVKPANVMYELESDTVKVTDFGIARITDSSKTKTGMVLGTPSYMSPEQLAGKKIEGRSDLFSLGVTLYQLVSGHLPFQGDSMAQLMFKIANEPHVDILTYNANLPPCLVDIINKALSKQPETRFQTGEEMAQAIKACAANVGGGSAGAKQDVVDIGL